MSKKIEVVSLDIKDIVPDENQPREYFDPIKIKNLKNSITRFGIQEPITVEKIGNKYLLINGERRYRAATELGLKELPAVIQPAMDKVERLVLQFHIQEQHEGWTPTEKAKTVSMLSEQLGLSVLDLSRMLGIEDHTIKRYISFSALMDKKEFVKHEMNLHWAVPIVAIEKLAEKISMDKMKEPFGPEMKKKLERTIITQIKLGEVTQPAQLSKLKDSFTKDPSSIEKFMTKNVTISELFLETKAQDAYHLRYATNSAGYVSTHLRKYLENRDVVPTAAQINTINSAKRAIDDFLATIKK